MEVVNLLDADQPLLRRHVDHPLSGEWKDFRDCHIRAPQNLGARGLRAPAPRARPKGTRPRQSRYRGKETRGAGSGSVSLGQVCRLSQLLT